MLLVDYGNLYVVSVTDVRSAIYGERVTVQAFRVVLHNLIPGNDGGWNESFLDWLMETINYDKPGYNDVFEVEILGDSVSHPLPVVDTSSIGVLHHPFKFCRAAKGHLVETGNVESSIS